MRSATTQIDKVSSYVAFRCENGQAPSLAELRDLLDRLDTLTHQGLPGNAVRRMTVENGRIEIELADEA